jgi:hypothetical protein
MKPASIIGIKADRANHAYGYIFAQHLAGKELAGFSQPTSVVSQKHIVDQVVYSQPFGYLRRVNFLPVKKVGFVTAARIFFIAVACAMLVPVVMPMARPVFVVLVFVRHCSLLAYA